MVPRHRPRRPDPVAIDDRTLRLAAGMRLQVGALVDDEQSQLLTSWARAWNEVAPEWEAALNDLAATSKDGKWPTRTQIARAKRAQQALEHTTDALTGLARDMDVRVLRVLPRLTGMTATWQARIIGAQMPNVDQTPDVRLGVDWDRVDPKALDAIVTRAAGQVQSRSYPLAPRAVAAMKSEIIRGIAVGDNPRVAAARMLARVEGHFNGGLTRALVIARTEMISAHREAAWAQDQAATDVLAGWTWTCALDRRACPACLAMHGTVHPVADPGPLGHQQCRCSRTPKAKSWRDLGFDIDEPADIFPDARSWFEDLPEGSQLDIMGKARLDLLKSGSVTWDDLATRRTSAGWRDSFVPTPLSALLAKAS